jgi:hypothetical protein
MCWDFLEWRLALAALAAPRMPEGEPIPSNMLAELRHDMAHRRFVKEQLKQIEGTRRERLDLAPNPQTSKL